MSSNPTKEPENDNGGNKSFAAENIVKMSLSKSNVNGTFQFSKISIDNAKTSSNKVKEPAKSPKMEVRPGPADQSPESGRVGEDTGPVRLDSGALVITGLVITAGLTAGLYFVMSRNILDDCSYFPQDMTDKPDDVEDDQNNCDDEFVYISPLTAV